MDENTNIVEEILHDLFSSMEALETQNTAILQFLRDKGIATDEELASHLERAGNASSVRWRGVRVRADYLFASAIKAAEQESKAATKQSGEKETAKGAPHVASSDKPENDNAENAEPENNQPRNDKPEADEASARVKQEIEQNVERDIEQDVKRDRNQRDDADNRPRKSDPEKAA